MLLPPRRGNALKAKFDPVGAGWVASAACEAVTGCGSHWKGSLMLMRAHNACVAGSYWA